MSIFAEFERTKDELKQFIVDNPCCTDKDLMNHFQWSADWRRQELTQPLKKGYGINGNEIFLFRSRINGVSYYFEWGYAMERDIPQCFNIGNITADERRSRDRLAKEKRAIADAESLDKNLADSFLMKPTKSI